MTKKWLFALAGSLLMAQANAAMMWSDGNQVLSVAQFYDGGSNVIEVTLKNAVASGCASQPTTNKLYTWNAPPLPDYLRLLHDAALAAATTGAMADIEYNNTNCYSASSGGKTFLGPRYEGMRITPPQQ